MYLTRSLNAENAERYEDLENPDLKVGAGQNETIVHNLASDECEKTVSNDELATEALGLNNDKGYISLAVDNKRELCVSNFYMDENEAAPKK